MKEMFVKKEKRDSVGEREGVCEIERETESEWERERLSGRQMEKGTKERLPYRHSERIRESVGYM